MHAAGIRLVEMRAATVPATGQASALGLPASPASTSARRAPAPGRRKRAQRVAVARSMPRGPPDRRPAAARHRRRQPPSRGGERRRAAVDHAPPRRPALQCRAASRDLPSVDAPAPRPARAAPGRHPLSIAAARAAASGPADAVPARRRRRRHRLAAPRAAAMISSRRRRSRCVDRAARGPPPRRRSSERASAACIARRSPRQVGARDGVGAASAAARPSLRRVDAGSMRRRQRIASDRGHTPAAASARPIAAGGGARCLIARERSGSARSSPAAVGSPISSSSVGARSASRAVAQPRALRAADEDHRHRVQGVRRVRLAGHADRPSPRSCRDRR